MLSCSMFRRRISETEFLKSIIKPKIMYLRLTYIQHNIFIVLDTTWLHVKVHDCFLELLIQIGAC